MFLAVTENIDLVGEGGEVMSYCVSQRAAKQTIILHVRVALHASQAA